LAQNDFRQRDRMSSMVEGAPSGTLDGTSNTPEVREYRKRKQRVWSCWRGGVEIACGVPCCECGKKD